MVHGEDGMDEISLTGKTDIAEVWNGTVNRYAVAPENFGLPRCTLKDLQCSSKEEHKEQALKILGGIPGAKADIVCLNAGAALYAAERALSIGEGIAMARKAVEQGAALKKLNEIIEFSQ